MNEEVRLPGVSRKQLDDIKTIRNYGCQLDLELSAKIKIIYKAPLDDLIGDLMESYYSDFFVRPRKRIGSKARK